MLSAIIFSLIAIVIIGIIVFGGGQVFMPIYQNFWLFISNKFDLNITQEKIDTIFTITNSTPGVVSTKFAAFTGILISNGAWWGWIVSLLTYLVFCLPSVFLMILSVKLIKNTEKNKYLKKVITFLNPVISGILIALAIQLFIAITFPNVYFNNLDLNYFGFKNSDKTVFFSGWRFIALIIYSLSFIVFSILWSIKKKPIIYLIIISVLCAFIVFQPWL
ncbi:chromate transporter [Mesomycoplasma molare]|uniref:Chromate transporter n=1 Tax=Mesomycoplasma molare TaxID=171288 RepID=A0ABY5TYN7_9BACT|nr:chromate transporter [Mesomycoplasma molare]UWD34149.1 chromate transporter [Mesomycoplasma molare]